MAARRRLGPPALHRPAHGADAGREGAPPGGARRAALLATRTRAPSPARSARRCWPASGRRYVIVGHSERRTLFGMTDDVVAATLRAVLRNGMTPDLLRRRDRGAARRRAQTETRARATQVLAALSGLPRRASWPAWCIAYEPIWAIGTGQAGHRRWTPRTPASSSARWWPRSAGPRRPRRCGSSTGAR